MLIVYVRLGCVNGLYVRAYSGVEEPRKPQVETAQYIDLHSLLAMQGNPTPGTPKLGEPKL